MSLLPTIPIPDENIVWLNKEKEKVLRELAESIKLSLVKSPAFIQLLNPENLEDALTIEETLIDKCLQDVLNKIKN